MFAELVFMFFIILPLLCLLLFSCAQFTDKTEIFIKTSIFINAYWGRPDIFRSLLWKYTLVDLSPYIYIYSDAIILSVSLLGTVFSR